MRSLAAALALAALLPGGCATSPHAPGHAYPEAAPFDPALDAAAALDAALRKAGGNGKAVLLVMGANWCHDSRALAGWLATPRFEALAAERYEVVFVDVGTPQTGKGVNLDIARRFGIEVERTPTVLVLSAGGELLNPGRAKKWNDAASRREDAIYAELAGQK